MSQSCNHCGDPCKGSEISLEDKSFCCVGCRSVFQLLQGAQLDDYYKLESSPGLREAQYAKHELSFLDDPEIVKEWLDYIDEERAVLRLNLPQIHCSSCVWLLERLHRLHPGILQSSVHFSKKQLQLRFDPRQVRLKEVIVLLGKIGYPPQRISPQQKGGKPERESKTLIYQIGVAGFCFGNIMLLAFPEYLGMDHTFSEFQHYFGIVALLLSLPVVLFAGRDYLKNAFLSLRQNYINMDVPLALGILTLFVRSTYEVVFGVGAGYFDSLAGLVFFLLLGKWFQQRTYKNLTFDRDYRAYFPMAVTVISGKGEQVVRLEKLQRGDRVLIHQGEIIPADAQLLEGKANIDYSFVTGESRLVTAQEGDQLYAGGRQKGASLEVVLTKGVDNSYLTQLWNQAAFQKGNKQKTEGRSLSSLADQTGKYFTIAILSISLLTCFYWSVVNPEMLWLTLTSVLIVACPCALALSVPFTYGNTLRYLGKMGLYLKNTGVVEDMGQITDVVFDKTGTLTQQSGSNVDFHGTKLNGKEQRSIKSLLRHSMHPLSKTIGQSLPTKEKHLHVDAFEEVTAQGLSGRVGESDRVQIGSSAYLNIRKEIGGEELNTRVYVGINGQLRGFFELVNSYRAGFRQMISALKKRFRVHLLSGDNAGEREKLLGLFGARQLHFNQSPMEKLGYVQALQTDGSKVLMLGDGLNDAGALKESKVGFAVADNIHHFSPACDGILEGEALKKIPDFLRFAEKSQKIVKLCFLISFLYNIVGLSFAVSGHLSPLVAAVLMPLSSVSVVGLASALVWWNSRRMDFNS